MSTRFDVETGALTKQEMPPSCSASDRARYLKNPKRDEEHPLLLGPGGIITIVGQLGCGKSSLIYSILKEYSEILNMKEVGRIMYYTGSGSDKILDHYKDSDMEIYDPKSKESFQNALTELHSEEIEHDKKKLHIIILEDCSNDASLMPASVKNETPLSRVMMSARHVPAIIVLTAQKHTSLPTFARVNASHSFVFRTKSPAELAAVIRDASFTRKEVEDAFSTLTDRYSCIWLQNLSRKIVKNMTIPLCH